jgi:hypothetical protein
MFGTPNKKIRPVFRVVPRVEALDARDVPTVKAINDIYTAQVGQVLTVPVTIGLLSNDFSDSNFGAVLVADLKTAPTINGVGPALPANALTLNSNGSFQFIVPSTFNVANSPITFTYQARDADPSPAGIADTPGTATVTIVVNNSSNARYAAATGEGAPNEVRVFNPSNGLEAFSFSPYESTFTGGVRVATGDFNQDGVDDIVTAPGFGGSSRIVVTDGRTGTTLASFFAFEPTFRGGGYVAVGDVNGDFVPDIIVGAGDGGGPRVQVYDGTKLGLPPIADFFAYEPTFRNGVRVAAGNLDGDDTGSGTGTYEIITGAGPGGGPAVKVFDATGIFGSGSNPTPIAKMAFFAFDSSQRGGVNVAAGEFRGDGKADIIVGSGSGAPVVEVFDGRSGAQLRSFTVPNITAPTGGTPASAGGTGLFAPSSGNLLPPTTVPGSLIGAGGASNASGGIRVAAIDRNGDGLADIITGAGRGNAPRVQIFDGNTLTLLDNSLAFDGSFSGGVYVGGHAQPATFP